MTALLDTDQLRTFIAIAETGSFTKAADVVNKTQSAVSMQMKRLEERLERPIFARDGRASKLTEDGERLLDYARRIVKLNVEALATFSKTELSGRVRLGVPDDYADRYLPEIMARFSRASERLSSDEMMCSASASASFGRSCGLRISPTSQAGSSGNPSAGVSTRMPGRSPDSGNTETASPDSTAAPIAAALPLE